MPAATDGRRRRWRAASRGCAAAGVPEPRGRRRGAARARARHRAAPGSSPRRATPLRRRRPRRGSRALLGAARAARAGGVPRRRARVLVAAARGRPARPDARARRPSCWSRRRCRVRSRRAPGARRRHRQRRHRRWRSRASCPARRSRRAIARATRSPSRAATWARHAPGVRLVAGDLLAAFRGRRVRPRRLESALRAPTASSRRSRPRCATSSRASRSPAAPDGLDVLRALVADGGRVLAAGRLAAGRDGRGTGGGGAWRLVAAADRYAGIVVARDLAGIDARGGERGGGGRGRGQHRDPGRACAGGRGRR